MAQLWFGVCGVHCVGQTNVIMWEPSFTLLRISILLFDLSFLANELKVITVSDNSISSEVKFSQTHQMLLSLCSMPGEVKGPLFRPVR